MFINLEDYVIPKKDITKLYYDILSQKTFLLIKLLGKLSLVFMIKWFQYLKIFKNKYFAALQSVNSEFSWNITSLHTINVLQSYVHLL